MNALTQRNALAPKTVGARANQQRSAATSRGALQIVNAATKEKKNRDLERLKTLATAEETLLVAGFRYQGLTVKDMIAFRRAMPEGAHIMVAKNTLMRKAIEGTQFEALGEATTGMNAWVFVDENIATTMKAVKGLTKDWNKAGKEVAFTGAVMDGQFIPANKMAPLEDLPTKLDLITKIAVGIKQVPTKLARGTKGTANKLGYATQAIAEGKSDLIQA